VYLDIERNQAQHTKKRNCVKNSLSKLKLHHDA